MHPENPHSNVRDLLTSYRERHPPAQSSMANEAETIRAIVQRMLNALDEYTQQACVGNQENTTFWNGKESPLSVLVKLTQVLTRLPDGQKLKSGLEHYLHPVCLDELRPADILLCRLDGNPQHVALVTDYAHGGLGMIHAYAQARKVVENRLDEKWRSSVVGAYRFGAFVPVSS